VKAKILTEHGDKQLIFSYRSAGNRNNVGTTNFIGIVGIKQNHWTGMCPGQQELFHVQEK
jgi:hypothetical protein